jgi:very-short-patch-repair endonuclease
MPNERARTLRKTMSDGERNSGTRDARRDRWLNTEGYRVLRFPAIDVFQNLHGVVDSIWAALQEMSDARASRHPHQERHRT